jgi:hypothetical protein
VLLELVPKKLIGFFDENTLDLFEKRAISYRLDDSIRSEIALSVRALFRRFGRLSHGGASPVGGAGGLFLLSAACPSRDPTRIIMVGTKPCWRRGAKCRRFVAIAMDVDQTMDRGGPRRSQKAGARHDAWAVASRSRPPLLLQETRDTVADQHSALSDPRRRPDATRHAARRSRLARSRKARAPDIAFPPDRHHAPSPGHAQDKVERDPAAFDYIIVR